MISNLGIWAVSLVTLIITEIFCLKQLQLTVSYFLFIYSLSSKLDDLKKPWAGRLTERYGDFALCTQVVLGGESDLGADLCLILGLLRSDKVGTRSRDLFHALGVAAKSAVYIRQVIKLHCKETLHSPHK